MIHRLWRHASIATRLIFITVLPTGLVFFAFVLATYQARFQEVREELEDRARVITSALAESSEYGVISGNLADLERVVGGLVRADRNIYQIEVFDAQSRLLLRSGLIASREPDKHKFDADILRQIVTLDEHEEEAAFPRSLAENQTPRAVVNGAVIGHIVVIMSPTAMMATQRHRAYLQTALAVLVLGAAFVLALCLGRGLSLPLVASLRALRQIRAGNLDVQVHCTAGGEIGELQELINSMTHSLRQAKQGLEEKVRMRTRELEESRNAALKADNEKRKLIQQVNSVVEDERRSIAVEIHDELNATLIAARLHLQRILLLATAEEGSPAIEEIRDKAQSTIKLTLDLYASARNIVRRLRPEVLDMLGLQGAVEEMLDTYDRGHHACRFRFHYTGDPSTLSSELAITAYRLIQEALSNAVKHAAASLTKVSLIMRPEENLLLIEVQDNGTGYDPAANNPGIGLIGMRERAHGFGGHIEVRTGPEQGTLVTIRLPLNSARDVGQGSAST